MGREVFAILKKRIIVAAEIQLEKSFVKNRETETAREAGRRRGYD